jgi:choline dehydrogenase-like flavoprotein
VELYPSISGLPPLTTEDDLSLIPTQLPAGRTSLMTVHLFSSCPMGENRALCATDSFGRVHGAPDLYIHDASLLCTAPGVNPQGSIMALARRNTLHYLENR